MAELIRAVVGDDKPLVTLTLADRDTAVPYDLSAAGTSVDILFRAAGSTTLLSTISCSITDGVNGVVEFDFAGGALDGIDAGMYEGEIEIDFDGLIHTVYDLLKFRVRDDFN